MRDYFLRFTKGLLRSRIGLFLSLINIIYFIIIFWERGLQAGGIHPFNESLLTQIFLVVNLPAMILALIFSAPLIASGIGTQRAEILFLLCFIGIFVQWQIIGYLIERFALNRLLRKKDSYS